MAHDDLQRLSLRLGVVGAMTAQAKETAGRLSSGADEYERALLKRTNMLARQIRREGVGKNPKQEQEYCELLMQRRRMLQSYELAKQDAAKSPDVTATKSLRKSLQPLPFEALPTIYLIASSPAARQLAVSLSSSGIEALATSDLESAVETAAIFHEVLGVPVAAPQPGFRAWDLGALSGLPDKDTGPFVRRYIEDHADAAPPGGESFNAYHERFMTSLTPMLILVGRGVRRAIGIVTDPRNLLLAQAWLHSGGKLGDLNLEYFVGRVLDPGTVLRMTLTAEGWEGTLFPPVPEHQGEGLFIAALPPDMTLMKGRGGKGTQPGQLGFSFDEEAHPRQQAGEHDPKYRGGEFVPKDQGAAGGTKLTLYRQGEPVGRSGAGTFYAFNSRRLARDPKRYEKVFHNILDVPEEMHGPFAGNPSESLRRQWLPHLSPHEVWLKQGKKLGHKSAVDTGDWLVAHAAHERGHDAIRYSDLELQSLLDGFKPNPLFDNLARVATEDPREAWKELGTRSQAFKAWFGDWENNSKMASKVVDADGKPEETYPTESSQVMENGRPTVVYHGTGRGGFDQFDPEHLNPHSLMGPGFYFTESSIIANDYMKKEQGLWGLDRDLTPEDMEQVKELLRHRKEEGEDPDKWGSSTELLSATNLLRAAEKGPEAFAEMLGGSHSDVSYGIRQKLRVKVVKTSKPTVYTVYLNIRRPYIGDRKLTAAELSKLWDALPEDGEFKSSPKVQRDPETWKKTWADDLKGKTLADAFEFLGHVYGSRPDLTQALKSLGFDGISHMGGGRVGGGKHMHRVWIAFEPEQIKSADNEGTFDPTSPDIRKSINGGPFVPPDMPRWQQRPDGGEQRFLPLNGVEDRDKLRGMIETMRDGKWTWDQPIVHSGDQLLTGSHRYHAAKEAGIAIPLKDFGEVCQEGGIDFEKEWRERAEPYGGWISNVSNVIRLLPEGLAAKYGIELG